MPSVASSIQSFISSIISIFVNLANSVLAVFTTILALAQDIVTSAISLIEALFQAVLDLFSGAIGFVLGNFVILAILGIGYYIYTQQTGKKIGTKKHS